MIRAVINRLAELQPENLGELINEHRTFIGLLFKINI